MNLKSTIFIFVLNRRIAKKGSIYFCIRSEMLNSSSIDYLLDNLICISLKSHRFNFPVSPFLNRFPLNVSAIASCAQLHSYLFAHYTLCMLFCFLHWKRIKFWAASIPNNTKYIGIVVTNTNLNHCLHKKKL